MPTQNKALEKLSSMTNDFTRLSNSMSIGFERIHTESQCDIFGNCLVCHVEARYDLEKPIKYDDANKSPIDFNTVEEGIKQ